MATNSGRQRLGRNGIKSRYVEKNPPKDRAAVIECCVSERWCRILRLTVYDPFNRPTVEKDSHSMSEENLIKLKKTDAFADYLNTDGSRQEARTRVVRAPEHHHRDPGSDSN